MERSAKIILWVAVVFIALALDHMYSLVRNAEYNSRMIHEHLHELGCHLEAVDSDGITYCDWKKIHDSH